MTSWDAESWHALAARADSERAAAMADELVCQVPADAQSYVARARTKGVFHRFTSSLTELDTAAALGADGVEVDGERAAICQALGRYDGALAIRRLAVDRHPDFSALAALAGVYGERGELDERSAGSRRLRQSASEARRVIRLRTGGR